MLAVPVLAKHHYCTLLLMYYYDEVIPLLVQDKTSDQHLILTTSVWFKQEPNPTKVMFYSSD